MHPVSLFPLLPELWMLGARVSFCYFVIAIISNILCTHMEFIVCAVSAHFLLLDTSFRGNTCIRLCENNLPEMRKVLLQLNFLLLTLCHGLNYVSWLICSFSLFLVLLFYRLGFVGCSVVINYKLENFNFFSALFLILSRALTQFILHTF